MKREPIRSWFARHIKQRVPSPSLLPDIDWQRQRGLLKLRLIVLLFILSVAGIIAGVGFFVLTLVQMYYLGVGLSSLLLGGSVSGFVYCYLWFTAPMVGE